MIICKLPEEVQHLIRSGLTITNVSQCVIELVLNSLDADSTCIGVRVDLNKYQLQVVDNGFGLNKEQLEVVGQRYMTSKCSSVADFENKLKWYGYRGEALASIRESCEALIIVSKPEGYTTTYSKVMKGPGEVHERVMKAMLNRPGHGTTVVVNNLFHSLPVRRKRMHRAIELEQLRSQLQAVALIHPQVSFTLRNDVTKTVIFRTKHCTDIVDNFNQLSETVMPRDAFVSVSCTLGHFDITGYICKKTVKNKRCQYLYVNKRFIENKKLYAFLNRKLSESFYLRTIFSKKNRSSPRHMFQINTSSPRTEEYHNENAIFIINIKCPFKEYSVSAEPKKHLVEFTDWDLLLKSLEKFVDKFLEQEKHLHQIDTLVETTTEAPGVQPSVLEKQTHNEIEHNEISENEEVKDELESLRRNNKTMPMKNVLAMPKRKCSDSPRKEEAVNKSLVSRDVHAGRYLNNDSKNCIAGGGSPNIYVRNKHKLTKKQPLNYKHNENEDNRRNISTTNKREMSINSPFMKITGSPTVKLGERKVCLKRKWTNGHSEHVLTECESNHNLKIIQATLTDDDGRDTKKKNDQRTILPNVCMAIYKSNLEIFKSTHYMNHCVAQSNHRLKNKRVTAKHSKSVNQPEEKMKLLSRNDEIEKLNVQRKNKRRKNKKLVRFSIKKQTPKEVIDGKRKQKPFKIRNLPHNSNKNCSHEKLIGDVIRVSKPFDNTHRPVRNASSMKMFHSNKKRASMAQINEDNKLTDNSLAPYKLFQNPAKVNIYNQECRFPFDNNGGISSVDNALGSRPANQSQMPAGNGKTFYTTEDLVFGRNASDHMEKCDVVLKNIRTGNGNSSNYDCYNSFSSNKDKIRYFNNDDTIHVPREKLKNAPPQSFTVPSCCVRSKFSGNYSYTSKCNLEMLPETRVLNSDSKCKGVPPSTTRNDLLNRNPLIATNSKQSEYENEQEVKSPPKETSKRIKPFSAEKKSTPNWQYNNITAKELLVMEKDINSIEDATLINPLRNNGYGDYDDDDDVSFACSSTTPVNLSPPCKPFKQIDFNFNLSTTSENVNNQNVVTHESIANIEDDLKTLCLNDGHQEMKLAPPTDVVSEKSCGASVKKKRKQVTICLTPSKLSFKESPESFVNNYSRGSNYFWNQTFKNVDSNKTSLPPNDDDNKGNHTIVHNDLDKIGCVAMMSDANMLNSSLTTVNTAATKSAANYTSANCAAGIVVSNHITPNEIGKHTMSEETFSKLPSSYQPFSSIFDLNLKYLISKEKNNKKRVKHTTQDEMTIYPEAFSSGTKKNASILSINIETKSDSNRVNNIVISEVKDLCESNNSFDQNNLNGENASNILLGIFGNKLSSGNDVFSIGNAGIEDDESDGNALEVKSLETNSSGTNFLHKLADAYDVKLSPYPSTSKKVYSENHCVIGEEVQHRATDWKEHSLPSGDKIYIHKHTGMSSYKNPSTEFVSAFDTTARHWFVPKGMSPLQEIASNFTTEGLPNLSTDQKKSIYDVTTDQQVIPVKDENSESGNARPAILPLQRIMDDANDCTKHRSEIMMRIHFPLQKSHGSPLTCVFTKEHLQTAKVIGLLDNRFIVTVINITEPNGDLCNANNVIVLFDQHAVDERIRYERLLKDYKNDDGSFCSQSVNPPLAIDLCSNKSLIIRDFVEKFENLGLKLMANGNRILVSGVPKCLYVRAEKEPTKQVNEVLTEFINNLLDEQIDMLLNTGGTASSSPRSLCSIIMYEACRGAVKFGDSITISTAVELLRQLSTCAMPYQCAHGRPVLAPIVNLP